MRFTPCERKQTKLLLGIAVIKEEYLFLYFSNLLLHKRKGLEKHKEVESMNINNRAVLFNENSAGDELYVEYPPIEEDEDNEELVRDYQQRTYRVFFSFVKEGEPQNAQWEASHVLFYNDNIT